MKQPKGWLKLVLGIILSIVTIFAQTVFVIAWIYFTQFGMTDLITLAFSELAGGIIALLFMIALGGKSSLRLPSGAMSFAWKASKVFLIVDVILVVLGIIGQFAFEEAHAIADSWALNAVIVFFMCLGIGMFEEGIFRGLLLHGLLARMGTTKKGMVAALIITSLLFGLAHVITTDIEWNLLFWLQTLLKALQTGILGFVLGVVVIKTRSLVPAILIHALNDFILMVVYIAVLGESMDFQYVVSGEEGVETVSMYLFMCIIYLPSLMFSIRELKKVPKGTRGAFYHPKVYQQIPLQQDFMQPGFNAGGFYDVQQNPMQPRVYGDDAYTAPYNPVQPGVANRGIYTEQQKPTQPGIGGDGDNTAQPTPVQPNFDADGIYAAPRDPARPGTNGKDVYTEQQARANGYPIPPSRL